MIKEIRKLRCLNIHVGTEIARDHFEQMGSAQVVGGIISPVHDSYGKNGLVSATHRCNMIKIGLQSSDWIRLSEWETQQEEWTRTRLTLQYHQVLFVVTFFCYNHTDLLLTLELHKFLPERFQQ